MLKKRCSKTKLPGLCLKDEDMEVKLPTLSSATANLTGIHKSYNESDVVTDFKVKQPYEAPASRLGGLFQSASKLLLTNSASSTLQRASNLHSRPAEQCDEVSIQLSTLKTDYTPALAHRKRWVCIRCIPQHCQSPLHVSVNLGQKKEHYVPQRWRVALQREDLAVRINFHQYFRRWQGRKRYHQ